MKAVLSAWRVWIDAQDAIKIELARWLLRALIALVLISTVVTSLQTLQANKEDLRRETETLLWMQDKAADLQANEISRAPTIPQLHGSLLAVANESIKPFELTFQAVQPDGDNSLTVQLKDIAFIDALAWFRQLNTIEGLLIESVSINKETQPGRVGLDVTLTKYHDYMKEVIQSRR